MHILVDVGDTVKSSLFALSAAAIELKDSLQSLSIGEQLIESDTDLAEYSQARKCILMLTEGTADLRLGGFPLASLEPNDVISPSFLGGGGTLRCNFAVRAHSVPWSTCQDRIKGDHDLFQKWFTFVSAERALFSQLTAEFMARALGESAGESPLPQSVAPGETLIKQGDRSDEVFTLIEGRLDVFVDGIKVGQIDRDEIFGVISALAEAPRSASVVAATQSMVLKLPKADFLQLMRARPGTVLELVRSMARALVSANVRVVTLAKRLAT